MSRGLSSAVKTALRSNNVRIVTFAKLEFSSTTVYTHDGIGTYTWGGNDWLGVGDFGSVSTIQEGADVSPYHITLTLSALDSTYAGIALSGTEDYFMRPVTIYFGIVDEDDALVEDPAQIWAGFMDVMTVTSGSSGGDQISMTAESELAQLNRSKNVRYTHVQQQRQNSSDFFFEFLADIEGTKIGWGKKSSENLIGTQYQTPSYPFTFQTFF